MNMKKYVKQKNGFTLIELLVVIAIIGILSSIILASVNSARTRSRDARRKADVQTIQKAIELYLADYGNFSAILATDGVAASLDGQNFIQAYYFSTPTHPIGAGRNDWSVLEQRLAPYISKLPKDPLNGFNWTGYSNTPSLKNGYYFVGLASINVIQPMPCGGQYSKRVLLHRNSA